MTNNPASKQDSQAKSPAVAQPWGDFPTLMRHASRALAAGDLPRAGRFYQRAVELNPNSAQAWAGCARTSLNVDEAMVDWGYALALEPNDETRSVLSACVAKKIEQSGVQDTASLLAVGRRLAEAGQWAFAHDLFQCATELESSNEDAWIWRAGVAHSADETILCLKRVLELNPQNTQAKAGLAWAAKRTAAPVSADALQQAAVVLEEGQRAMREGDRVRAHERFQRATELDPRNASAWFWRGSTAPDADEALEGMEQVLAIDPENLEAKDSQWWLRVQSLREHSAALTHPQSLPPIIRPPAEQPMPERKRTAPIVAFLLVGCLVAALVILLWAVWHAGYFR